ncbi:MAG: hypothetical protein HOK28_16025 [Deltaproteobacteria bacterium]|nr:hypothetical protein [Deltaproteobacteria bacterium]
MRYCLKALVGCLLVTGFLNGCNTEPESSPQVTPDVTETETETEPDPELQPATITNPDDDASFLFESESVRTFELVVTPEDLAFIDNDPVAEIYVPATLKFEGEEYPDVGLRYKGSAGSYIGCTEVMGFPPSGPKTCIKLSMKVKLNYTDSDQKFHGLKKLQFHSMNSDDSLMRERLSYYLFRSMGIPAPRTTPIKVLVNGELAGLFLLVEQIDGRFTRSRFGDGGKGNLYKEIWPIHQDDASYINALETNEDENPSVEKMQRLRAELENPNKADRAAVSDAWIDRSYMASYLAVDRTIRNDDGIMHWYCNVDLGQGGNTGECGNHNYYWYEEEEKDRMWLIPWDTDLTFKQGGMVALPIAWDEEPDDCAPVSFGPFGYLPSACDPLISAWATFQEDYKAAVGTLLEGPYTAGNVATLLDTWQAQIADSVEEASLQDGQHLNSNNWLGALDELKTMSYRLRAEAEELVQSPNP